jgi:hypothetical protein
MKIKSVDDLETMPQKEFEEMFADKIHPAILADPITNFIRASKFVNFSPTPAQAVALKVYFGKLLDATRTFEIYEEAVDQDGQFELIRALKNEIDIFEETTQKSYDPTKHANNLINAMDLICGRRSGKTTLSAILSIFCAIKMNWLPFLSKTPSATVLVLSHTKDFSEDILDTIRSIIDNSPILYRLKDEKNKNTRSTFNLKVPFRDSNGKLVYSRVTIRVGAASKRTTRGKAVCALLADEACFWGSDENSKETDEEIFRAVRPSLLQFGKHSALFKLSSPAIKQGVVFDEYRKWQDDELPGNYIVFKAPSWVWNSTLPISEFKKEWQLDAGGFDTEFRANFVDSISNFILPEFVDLCVQRGVTFLPPEPRNSDITYTAAIDAAFKNDRFTFSLVGSNSQGKIKQYIMKAWEGSKKKPVQAFEVAQYIQKICREFGVGQVHADQFSFQPLKEIFEQYGITLIENTFTSKFKQQIYYNLKKLIHNQNLDILDHAELASEIKQLQVEQTSTGTVRIGHPVGGHDDCVTSTAVSCYLLTEMMGKFGIDSSQIASDPHQIPVDRNGKAFKAPSPEMLGEFMGGAVMDNSLLYERDPETGELRPRDELEDFDDDGTEFFIV